MVVGVTIVMDSQDMQHVIHVERKEMFSSTRVILRAFCYTNNNGRMSNTAVTRFEGGFNSTLQLLNYFKLKGLKQRFKADKLDIYLQHYSDLRKLKLLPFHLCHH